MELSKKEKAAYLLSMFGQNIFFATVSTGLLYYWQSVIFLPAGAISVIFLITKIFDAFKDLAMGTIIDKTHTKIGKCRPYLLASAVPCTVFTVLLFSGKSYDGSFNSILWAFVVYVVWGLFFSLTDVPLWTLPTVMTQDEKQRNFLLSFARIASTAAAALVSLAVVPFSQVLGNRFALSLGDSEAGLQKGMLTAVTVLSLAAGLLFAPGGLFTKERIKATEQPVNLWNALKIMFKSEPYRKILVSGILRSPVSLVGTVQTVFYSYYFGDNGRTPYVIYMIITGAASVLGQFSASFIVPKATKYLSSESLFVISNIFTAVPLFGIFVLYLLFPSSLHEPSKLISLSFLMLLLGVFSGAVNILQSYLIADAAKFEYENKGIKPDGIFFSGQSILVKISSGAASLISGIVFAAAGFSGEEVKKVNELLYAGASFKADPIFAKYRFALFLLLALIPAVFSLLSALPFIKQRQTK